MGDTTQWVNDDRGNRCSVEHFGSREAAQAALDTLKNCENCTNCSDCSLCSDCSDCSGCSDCSLCSGCSDCSGCSGCSLCSGCSGCSFCSGCSGCSRCSGCSDVKAGAWPGVPKIDRIHTLVYQAASQPGALEMFDWHKCEKTHCRAGWIVTLAGEAGRKLESFHNTELAAMLIYRESSPLAVHSARFYDENDAALADMRRMMELESQGE